MGGPLQQPCRPMAQQQFTQRPGRLYPKRYSLESRGCSLTCRIERGRSVPGSPCCWCLASQLRTRGHTAKSMPKHKSWIAAVGVASFGNFFVLSPSTCQPQLSLLQQVPLCLSRSFCGLCSRRGPKTCRATHCFLQWLAWLAGLLRN